MKTNSRFEIGTTCRVGVLSSLVAFAALGNSSGQEPLVLEELELLRPPGEACTVTFGAGEGQQIMGWSSPDLKCWVFGGACQEVEGGSYEFIDVGAIELPGQFYRFETFNPEVPLPPQYEQLRLELGDEGFANWLQSNLEQFGKLQRVTPEQLGELDESAVQQFQEMEMILDIWLKDLLNQAAPLQPELVLPPLFEELRIDWGDYDLGRLLVQNMDQWGNFHGICEPMVIELEIHEPILFEDFRLEEEVLELHTTTNGIVSDASPC